MVSAVGAVRGAGMVVSCNVLGVFVFGVPVHPKRKASVATEKPEMISFFMGI